MALPLVSVLLLLAGAAVALPAPVTLIDGSVVQGFAATSNVTAFLGIPFGNVTRFKAATRANPWTTVLNASAPGPACPQNADPVSASRSPPPQAEQCLSINIWRPTANSSAPRAIMLWLHGGSFLYESSMGAFNSYNGQMLAAVGDVIIVSANYRLDVLGWMSTSGGVPANLGLSDQRLAMQWLRDNAAAFGGDPARVTLWGESAGAISTMAHLVTPASKGLFKRAILQSSLGIPFFPASLSTQFGNFLAITVGCAPSNITCLQAVPLASLLNASASVSAASHFSALWYPTIDKQTQNQPLSAAGLASIPPSVDIMFGFDTDEAVYFYSAVPAVQENPMATLYQVAGYSYGAHAPHILGKYSSLYGQPTTNASFIKFFNAAFTDDLFRCATQKLGGAVRRASAWSYRFNVVQRDNSKFWPQLGLPACVSKVCHGAELSFVFGFQGLPASMNVSFSSAEQTLSSTMQRMWTGFAKTGNPGQGWPAFTSAARKTLVLDTRAGALSVDSASAGQCAFWDGIGYTAFKVPPL